MYIKIKLPIYDIFSKFFEMKDVSYTRVRLIVDSLGLPIIRREITNTVSEEC